MKGTIKRILSDKHFGFITGNDNKGYFFHRDDFIGFWDDLIEDSKTDEIHVDFKSSETSKGLRALNVNRLDYPNQSMKEV